MPATPRATLDGNEAVARVAYLGNEVIAIYPITPASAMGEHADEWAAQGRTNLWGAVPAMIEMQSEAGAAGVLHGALTGGALATSFTASQGLLLMIPNLYKIAGELTPFVLHVAARAVASHALSIFGDHSDVMACRGTGCAMLCAGSVQEAQDFAAIAQAATLAGRLPVIHFFDGFRTSHEVAKIDEVDAATLRAMLDAAPIAQHRARALSPEHPVLRGSSQNPDVFFQSRERANPYYDAFPGLVQAAMDRYAGLTGRHYRLFDYVGAADAERVIVIMGSGAETVHETVEHLLARGERVGVVKARLYRPFDAEALLAALPATVQAVAVLDRTKEPGADGEPLYKDVLVALARAGVRADVIGGRYGLAGKEFTPGMAKAVFDGLNEPLECVGVKSPSPLRGEGLGRGWHSTGGFTLGIHDDVTHLSLPWDEHFRTDAALACRAAVFWGLGADGTVSANKNSIKIIGEATDLYAQGYFVYDSKKSGAVTVSHLRFGPAPIRSAYQIEPGMAGFVACHQPSFLGRHDLLAHAAPGGVFLLNTQTPPDRVWDSLPESVRDQIVAKGLTLHIIDAYRVAEAAGMGRRTNTVMQTCFFAISGILPRDRAIAAIKEAVARSYGRKRAEMVELNHRAIDMTLANLHSVAPPPSGPARRAPPKGASYGAQDATELRSRAQRGMALGATEGLGEREPGSHIQSLLPPLQGAFQPVGWNRSMGAEHAPRIPHLASQPLPRVGRRAFVEAVTMPLIHGQGDRLPVSAFPPDGAWPVGTAKYEKRGIALEIPVWDADLCTQCGKCVFVCPHAAIRSRAFPAALALNAPPAFKHVPAKSKEYPPGTQIAYQVAPDDCTGCGDCVEACPIHDKADPAHRAINMQAVGPLRQQERGNYAYFEALPAFDRCLVKHATIPGAMLLDPLFEFSGACAGCGETPYIRLATQLFGDRMLIANATGCSSIYGGNLPTTPYTVNAEGRGPAWSNSLFEDNAEFGLGMRIAADRLMDQAKQLVRLLAGEIGADLAQALIAAEQRDEPGIAAQRQRVAGLRQCLVDAQHPRAAELAALADWLIRRSVWIVGGDGWAYDIGFGGLDHVLSLHHDVNILVLDTEVYSNTGGQTSKATPLGAVAKFAAAGKATAKKDLARMAMNYGHAYVAQIAYGAKDVHALRVMREAESYPGPSLVIAYSPCIAHGVDLARNTLEQDLAVKTGHWPLFRYDPRVEGNPFRLDSAAPSRPIADLMAAETRFAMLALGHPEAAAAFLAEAQREADRRYAYFSALAQAKPV